jgi:starch synthase
LAASIQAPEVPSAVAPAASSKRKSTTPKVNGAATLKPGGETPAKAAKSPGLAKASKPAAKPAKRVAATASPKAPARKKASPARTTKAVKKAAPVEAATPALSVLLVASEATPFARTGELADLVGSAAKALGALGHRVTLVVPKYAGVATPGAAIDRFTVSVGAQDEDATCYEVPLGPNARAILVEHPGFFEREFLYGSGEDDYGDNPRRFAFLSRAALEFAAREGERIDVVQAFDWQTGLVPVFLQRTYRAHPALSQAAAVFTIHDVAFQGLCPIEWLFMLGLDQELLSPEGLEYWGLLSLLKGGVNFADVVSTIDEDYQATLLTPGRGAGFEGVLASRGHAFRAVLDGEDARAREDAATVARRLAALYADAVAARAAR